MNKQELKIDQIIESYQNGQNKQMVYQIENYGIHSFFPDYHRFLESHASDHNEFKHMLVIFGEIVATYHILKDHGF